MIDYLAHANTLQHLRFVLFVTFILGCVTFMIGAISGKPWVFVSTALCFITWCIFMEATTAKENTYDPCQVKPNDMIWWTGHSGGKVQDWWVYVGTNDKDHFCLVHNQALYNMGPGYKVGQTYTGALVSRP